MDKIKADHECCLTVESETDYVCMMAVDAELGHVVFLKIAPKEAMRLSKMVEYHATIADGGMPEERSMY